MTIQNFKLKWYLETEASDEFNEGICLTWERKTTINIGFLTLFNPTSWYPKYVNQMNVMCLLGQENEVENNLGIATSKNRSNL